MQLLVRLVRVCCTSLYTAIKIDSVSSSNSHAVKCKHQLSVLLENLVLKQTSAYSYVCETEQGPKQDLLHSTMTF